MNVVDQIKLWLGAISRFRIKQLEIVPDAPLSDADLADLRASYPQYAFEVHGEELWILPTPSSIGIG